MDMDTVLIKNNLPYQDLEEQGGRFTFLFVLIGVFFGVIFYDLIGFDFLDELLALVLILKFSVRFLLRKTALNIPIFIVFGFSVFYLIYSFRINSNIPIAIFSDWVTQIKPFIGFFCMLALMPKLNQWHKLFLRRCCWLIFIYLFFIGLGGFKAQFAFCGHPSRYASSVVICSMLYLYCSEVNWAFFLKASLMISIGLFSGRSKFFGFFVLYELILLFTIKGYAFKWRLKDFLIVFITIGLIILVGWEKISFYFIEGAFDTEQTFARPALYFTSLEILRDFFPFGSGYASFATFFSGKYYSPIYEIYGIDQFWGLTPENPEFIADTYYPALAQFGVVGLISFFYFFIYIYKKRNQISKEKLNYRILVMMGILFFLIESTSDTTFTHNRGFVFFILMALSISEGSQQPIEENPSVLNPY